MDIRVGGRLIIRCTHIAPSVVVTVTDMQVMLEDNALRCIVYISDSNGNESSVGIYLLAIWVENAKKG